MVISGVHAVAKALEAGFGLELFVSNRKISARLNWLIALADQKECNVTIGELPDESSENNSQGVALEIVTPRYLNEKALIAAISAERCLWKSDTVLVFFSSRLQAPRVVRAKRMRVN